MQVLGDAWVARYLDNDDDFVRMDFTQVRSSTPLAWIISSLSYLFALKSIYRTTSVASGSLLRVLRTLRRTMLAPSPARLCAPILSPRLPELLLSKRKNVPMATYRVLSRLLTDVLAARSSSIAANSTRSRIGLDTRLNASLQHNKHT
jgi:hypothetical protein